MTSYNSLRWWQYRISEFQTLVCLDYVQQITGRQMSFSDRDGVSSWIRHLSATYVSLLCLPSEYSPKTCVQSCRVVQSLMAYMPWLLHLKKKKKKRKNLWFFIGRIRKIFFSWMTFVFHPLYSASSFKSKWTPNNKNLWVPPGFNTKSCFVFVSK